MKYSQNNNSLFTVGVAEGINMMSRVLSKSRRSLLLLTLVLLSPLSCAIPIKERMLFVNGYINVVVETKTEKQRNIALPHANIYLKKDGEITPIASTVSDLSGRFILKTKIKGAFQICVEAEGFDPKCSDKEFKLQDKNHLFGNFLLPLPLEVAHAYGNVMLHDGSTIRTFQPYMGVNAFGQVELVIDGDVNHRTYINNFGEYIIPSIPVSSDFELRVTVENEVIKRPVNKQTNLLKNLDYSFNFSLSNNRPELRLLSATVANKQIQEVISGSMVKIIAVAQDVDGDKLQYRWLLPNKEVIGPTNDSIIKWQAPIRKGRYEVTVLVSDSRGGYARRSLPIEVGDNQIPFSGIVVDSKDNPITGAQVEINGQLFNTNSKGRIKAEVPVNDRYVMTIRKDGVTGSEPDSYGTATFIYQRAVREGRWMLRKAQLFNNIDPTKPIVLRQSAKYRDCIGPLTTQINWKSYQNPTLFQWQDGNGQSLSIPEVVVNKNGNIERVLQVIENINPALVKTFISATLPPHRRQTEPSYTDDKSKGSHKRIERCQDGIKVEIPANSLVDQNGNAPLGKLRIALSSIEVNDSQMPGDYSATDENNTPVSMESFGAGSIEIGDGLQHYNLAPGKSAIISIPIDRSQASGNVTLATKIPFLYFDETKGNWEQEGFAHLSGVGVNRVYKKKVPHFSTVNADILKSGQSCVAVEVDPNAGFVAPLRVEVTLQPSVVNPDVVQVRTETFDISLSNVIINLPNNSDIALTPIVNGLKPDGSTGLVPAGVFIVNTGGPQTSLGNEPIQNPDGTYYSDLNGVPTGPCGSRVSLTNLLIPEPAMDYEFLQGLYFQSSNITEFETSNSTVAAELIAGANDYYDHVDERDKRDTFNAFLEENKFDEGSDLDPDEVELNAIFANSGDLGFGRDMHCRRNNADDGQFDYACYVTNFGQPQLDLPDQDDANNAHAGISPDATVAMEYSRVESPSSNLVEFPDNERAVKFYVYDTNAPDDPLITKADLDGFGERPIPQLCMICHGGQVSGVAADPNNPTGPQKGAFVDRVDILSMGSSFLPFDLSLYNFPIDSSKADQQASFKDLNESIVKGVATATDAAGSTGAEIVELIDKFYPAGVSDQVEDPLVSGWDNATSTSNSNRFYREVFAPTCRTCHIAQPFAAPSFDSKVEFENSITNIQNRVCNQKVMPHAKRTHQIFWTSLDPNMPAFLQLYGQTFSNWSTSIDSQCGQSYTSGNNVTSIYTNKIHPLLEARCISCHGAGGTGSGTSFVIGSIADTYNNLTSTNLIIPNSPSSSLLFQRLSGVSPIRMPQNGGDMAITDLDTNGIVDKDEIENWINSGAPGP